MGQPRMDPGCTGTHRRCLAQVGHVHHNCVACDLTSRVGFLPLNAWARVNMSDTRSQRPLQTQTQGPGHAQWNSFPSLVWSRSAAVPASRASARCSPLETYCTGGGRGEGGRRRHPGVSNRRATTGLCHAPPELCHATHSFTLLLPSFSRSFNSAAAAVPTPTAAKARASTQMAVSM